MNPDDLPPPGYPPPPGITPLPGPPSPRPRRRAPPWWPHNEPWPPQGPVWHGTRHRNRFVRRWGVGFWMLFALFWLVRPVLNELSRITRGADATLGWGLLPLVIAAGVFAGAFVLLTRRVAYPIADLVAAADRVSNRDFSVRVPERGPRSVRSVARAFNTMTSRLESEDRARRHLMADVAHELRTPLAVIQGRVEGLLDGVYDRDDQHLSAVLDDTRVLARLVEDLRTLATVESGALRLQKEPTDIGVLVTDAADAMRAEAQARGVALNVDPAADLPLADVDPVRIREVLTNLIVNALRHTPSGGTLIIGTRQQPGRISINVTDTGSGIPAEELGRIFERFFKGNRSSGSGLGLTIARDLVRAHGGEIQAESEIGKGTTIAFTVPN